MSQIKGYRELQPGQVERMNRFKTIEEDLTDALEFARRAAEHDQDAAALRWLAIARTDLETGFMFAIKAVARPMGGLGDPKTRSRGPAA